MNKNDILRNAVILPLSIGIVLAIIFCFYINSNIDRLLPVSKNTAFAYHDVIDAENKEIDANCLKDNDLIGYLQFGETKLNIRYEANYSNMVSSLSMNESSTPFDEIGSAYLKTTMSNAKLISKANKLEIDSIYGDFQYKLYGEVEFNNEYEVLSYAPKLSKSLVIYYQVSDGAGLASKYNALVLKEVG